MLHIFNIYRWTHLSLELSRPLAELLSSCSESSKAANRKPCLRLVSVLCSILVLPLFFKVFDNVKMSKSAGTAKVMLMVWSFICCTEVTGSEMFNFQLLWKSFISQLKLSNSKYTLLWCQNNCCSQFTVLICQLCGIWTWYIWNSV